MSHPDLVNAFYATQAKAPPPPALRRQLHRATDVPCSPEGLQVLSQVGNWPAVVQVAEQLAHQYSKERKTRPYLECVLARVTAYIQMDEHTKALSVLEHVGDLDDPKFYDPSAEDQCSVPFSMKFLYAVLPQYCEKPQSALTRLTELATLCQERATADANRAAVWQRRMARIQRALTLCYFEMNQRAMALDSLDRLAGAAKDAVAETLLCQQAGALALRSGNVPAAQAFFARAVKNAADAEAETDGGATTLCDTVKAMNDALLDVFRGRAPDAIARLEPYVRHLFTTPGAAGSKDASKKGEGIEAEFAKLTVSQPIPTELVIKLYACNTYVVCHQYVPAAERKTVGDSMQLLHDLVQQAPAVTLRLGPIVHNLATLYTWESQEAAVRKRQMLESLVTAFVCVREGLPRVLQRK